MTILKHKKSQTTHFIKQAPCESRYVFQDIVTATKQTTNPATSNPATYAIKPEFKPDYRKTGDRGWVSWLKAHDEQQRQERETTTHNVSHISVDKEPDQEHHIDDTRTSEPWQ